MTEAGQRLIGALKEARSIARGEQPAARIWHQGWAYVPQPRSVDEAIVTAAVLDAIPENVKALLADPNAVHANMLRGTIAKPSLAQIVHLYGERELLDHLSAERVLRVEPD